MEETKREENATPPEKGKGVAEFFLNILRGVAIGVAFIIPGFSGGSVAAILGIYEKVIGSITGLFKKFKESILFLLPVALGMILGVAALIVPIELGLRYYPIPTVSLFVGLALGGLPSFCDRMKGGRPKWTHIVALLFAFAAAAGMSFLPGGKEADLFSLDAGGYLLLVLVGLAGSCALIIPGISGSMLLLVFGYYDPVLRLVTEDLLHGNAVGTCLLVLFCLAVGLIAGFFLISFVMRFFLARFPRGTYFAIFGFVAGSVIAVYATTAMRATDAHIALYANPWYWVVSVLLLLVGAALSLALAWYARKKQKQ